MPSVFSQMGMKATCGDLRYVVHDAHRLAPVFKRAIPQLTITIVTACPQLAVPFHNERVAAAAVRLSDIVHHSPGFRQSAPARFAVAVLTKGPQAAVVANHERVRGTRGHSFHIFQDLNGQRLTVLRRRTELAVMIRAEAPERSIATESENMIAAGRDLRHFVQYRSGPGLRVRSSVTDLPGTVAAESKQRAVEANDRRGITSGRKIQRRLHAKYGSHYRTVRENRDECEEQR